MDIFEKHFAMLQNSRDIFEKYKNRGEIKAFSNEQAEFSMRGKELLTIEMCEQFMEVRSIHYYNVVTKKMGEYTFPEWLVCLNEKVLLEYVIPIFSGALKEYPMLCGMNCEWQVLYEITMISQEFWNDNREWKVYFSKIIKKVLFEYEQGSLISNVPENYLSQFEKFNNI